MTRTNRTRRKANNEKRSQQAELAYKHLLQVRDHDHAHMWIRSNVLLFLQAGLLAFVASNFRALIADSRPVLAALCIFGLIVAYFWHRITRGGSFWVDFWESKLQSIEHLVFGNTVNIFRNHPSRETNPKAKEKFKQQNYVSTRKSLRSVALLTVFLWLTLLFYILFAH